MTKLLLNDLSGTHIWEINAQKESLHPERFLNGMEQSHGFKAWRIAYEKLIRQTSAGFWNLQNLQILWELQLKKFGDKGDLGVRGDFGLSRVGCADMMMARYSGFRCRNPLNSSQLIFSSWFISNVSKSFNTCMVRWGEVSPFIVIYKHF
jgi:hypothetical protein